MINSRKNYLMYEIHFSKDVYKFIKSKDIKFKENVLNIFNKLAEGSQGNMLDTKPLRGLKKHYRLRVGRYRFLYEVNDDSSYILVYKADVRGSVYK